MTLEEFVAQTLLAITNGVSRAQNDAKVWIAPGRVDDEPVRSPQMVAFEIALTVNKEGSGGISVWSFGEGKGSFSSESLNRVSFEVPVFFQLVTPLHEKFAEQYPDVAEKMKGREK